MVMAKNEWEWMVTLLCRCFLVCGPYRNNLKGVRKALHKINDLRRFMSVSISLINIKEKR